MSPRKRGPTDQPDGLSPEAVGYAHLFPADRSRVQCEICKSLCPNIPDHLLEVHPTVELDFYVREFPGSPLHPGVPKLTPPPGALMPKEVVDVAVTNEEAEAHPGGVDGARMEKGLPEVERGPFRRSLIELLDQGFRGYQVVSVAYQMSIARRIRTKLEQFNLDSRGAIFPTEESQLLTKVEAGITATLKDLEKTLEKAREAKRKAEEPADDKGDDERDAPYKVIEAEMLAAEAWVRAHIGELSDRCPNPACGMMLQPPALPHWAYAPMEVIVSGVRHQEYAVWSPELWHLVHARKIRLSDMAYVLRMSPEGLRMTAERRGEIWPDGIVLEEEERLLREMIDKREFAETRGESVRL